MSENTNMKENISHQHNPHPIMRTYLILAIALLSQAAQAQINSTVEVENTFQPTVKDADRIHTEPQKQETKPLHYDVVYDMNTTATTPYVFQPIWAAGSDAVTKKNQNGYAHAGLGNNGNLSAMMAYGFNFTDDDILHLRANSEGYNAKVKTYDGDDKWKSRFYNTTLGAEFEHKFNHETSLILASHGSIQNLNYQPTIITTPQANTNCQRNTLFDVSATFTPYRINHFSIGAKLGFDGFWQAHPTNFDDVTTLPYGATKTYDWQNRENIIHVSLNAMYHVNDTHHAGLDLKMLNESYSEEFDNYNTITVGPHYLYTDDKLTLKIGARMDFSSGFASDVHFAPDVKVEYKATPQATLFAYARGGEKSNDFRMLNSISPYWMFSPQGQLKHQFDQFDARLGMKWRPINGLSATLSAGYKMQEDRAEISTILDSPTMKGKVENNGFLAHYIHTEDGDLFFGEVNVDYTYTDRLSLCLNNRLNGWSYKHDDIHRAPWRKNIELDYHADARVYKTLHANLDFNLTTYRTDKEVSYKPKNRIELGGGLSYSFENLPVGLTVFTKCHTGNLGSKAYDAFYCYKAQAFHFLCGGAVSF